MRDCAHPLRVQVKHTQPSYQMCFHGVHARVRVCLHLGKAANVAAKEAANQGCSQHLQYYIYTVAATSFGQDRTDSERGKERESFPPKIKFFTLPP